VKKDAPCNLSSSSTTGIGNLSYDLAIQCKVVDRESPESSPFLNKSSVTEAEKADGLSLMTPWRSMSCITAPILPSSHARNYRARQPPTLCPSAAKFGGYIVEVATGQLVHETEAQSGARDLPSNLWTPSTKWSAAGQTQPWTNACSAHSTQMASCIV
jgi:hypothetical protein